MKKTFTALWTEKQETIAIDGLTEKEISVLIASRINEFNDCLTDGATWSFTVCDNANLDMKVYRGVVSSLIKKGFAEICGEGGNEVFGLTDKGKALFSDNK